MNKCFLNLVPPWLSALTSSRKVLKYKFLLKQFTYSMFKKSNSWLHFITGMQYFTNWSKHASINKNIWYLPLQIFLCSALGCRVLTIEKAIQAADLWTYSVHALPAWGTDSWEHFYFMDSLLCYHASTRFGRLFSYSIVRLWIGFNSYFIHIKHEMVGRLLLFRYLLF